MSNYIYNITFEGFLRNYIPSDSFMKIFNERLKEISDNFRIYQRYLPFLQYPEELDYMILSLKSFKDELNEIVEEINKYAYQVILYELDFMYDVNSEYIYIFVKSNKNYLFSN